MAQNPNPDDPNQASVNNPSTQAPHRLSDAPDDLTDSSSDRERLREEITYIDLPEVKDIPGQENITVAPLGELADVTISSDDEEGLINDDSDDLDILDNTIEQQ
jgi:hypothetical protein